MMNIEPIKSVKKGFTNLTLKGYKLYNPKNATINYLANEKMVQNDCKKCNKMVQITLHYFTSKSKISGGYYLGIEPFTEPPYTERTNTTLQPPLQPPNPGSGEKISER